MLSGLARVNIELTSRCGKTCWMCGRRKVEREYPELAKWGDMPYEMVKSIARQLPDSIVVAFHDNGEPTLYPRLGDALSLFENKIRCFDTNGKLLLDKMDEIVGNLDTLTLSVFEKDTEQQEQLEIMREFVSRKGDKSPNTVIRILGDVDPKPYEGLGIICHRQFHSPMGSFDYQKRPPIPEIGICLEMLHHLSIKRDGSVSICVRFDPHRKGVIGNLNQQSLDEIWNGIVRRIYLDLHIKGERKKVPLCETCEYWGCVRD